MPKSKKARKSDNVYDFDDSCDATLNVEKKNDSEESDEESVVLTRLRKKNAQQPTPPRPTRSSKRLKKQLGPPSGKEELYCTCRKPYDNRFMIECDTCHEWFHGDCVGISLRQGKLMEKRNEDFICESCKERQPVGKETEHSIHGEESDEDDESISLAAIRQKISLDEQSESANSNESSSASALVSQLKMEVEQMKDFSSLLSSDRLMTANDKVVEKDAKEEEAEEEDTSKPDSTEAGVKPEPSKEPKPEKKSPEKVKKHAEPASASHPSAPPVKKIKLRLSVIDAKSGRLINDHKLVNEKTIEKFIARHPTFRIVTPQVSSSMLPTPPSTTPTSSSAPTSSTTTSPGMMSSFRITVRQELRDALKLRVEGSEDAIGMFSAAEINRSALRIEESMFKMLGGCQSDKYKQRFRCLLLNIKDQRNKTLFKRILSGSFGPDELATVPAERFASEELAQWREQQRKKSLEMLIIGGKGNEPGSSAASKQAHSTAPAARGTTAMTTNASASSSSLTHHDLSTLDESFRIDTTANHRSHLFDVNCKLCTGKSEPAQPRSKSVFSAYSALAKEPVKSSSRPVSTQSAPLTTTTTTTSHPLPTSRPAPPLPTSRPAPPLPTSRPAPPLSTSRPAPPLPTVATSSATSSHDTVTPTPSVAPSTWKPPPVQEEVVPASYNSPNSPPRPQMEVEWTGHLKLDAQATSEQISGHLISVTQFVHLDNFPDTLEIIGKLGTLAVWEYLDKIRRSGNKEIVVILLEPTESTESTVNYRTTLANLKEKTRFAVVKTVGAPVVGGFKDIYITFTSREWLRRLSSLGVKFTEQIPVESKLACILVRYTTLPIGVVQQQQQPLITNVPLIKTERITGYKEEPEDVSPTRKISPRKGEESPKNIPVSDVTDDDDYDPSELILPQKREIEPPQSYVVKTVTQQAGIPENAATDKTPAADGKFPQVLSTPEEVSSVSEIIRRILGGAPPTPTTTTTTSATTTATETPVIAPVGKNEKLVTAPADPRKETQQPPSFPAVPSFPPPPPGFLPPPFQNSANLERPVLTIPPFPMPEKESSPPRPFQPPPFVPPSGVDSPVPPEPPNFAPPFMPAAQQRLFAPMPPGSGAPPTFPPPSSVSTAPLLPNFPPSSATAGPPTFPPPLPSSMANAPPNLPPSSMPIDPPTFPPHPSISGAPSAFPPPLVPGPGFPPPIGRPQAPFPNAAGPPFGLPPSEGHPLGLPPSQGPPLGRPLGPVPNAAGPPLGLPPSQGPPPPGLRMPPGAPLGPVSSAEFRIRNYLDQLMDESLSLVVRSSLLQELAGLLQNPSNEDIVRQNPELTARFQKAVAIVNSVVDNRQNEGKPPQNNGNGPPPRKALLPTPNIPALVEPSVQQPPARKSPVENAPEGFFSFKVNRKEMSGWRKLVRSFRERCKATKATNGASQQAPRKGDRGDDSRFSDRKLNDKPAARSRWEEEFSGASAAHLKARHGKPEDKHDGRNSSQRTSWPMNQPYGGGGPPPPLLPQTLQNPPSYPPDNSPHVPPRKSMGNPNGRFSGRGNSGHSRGRSRQPPGSRGRHGGSHKPFRPRH